VRAGGLGQPPGGVVGVGVPRREGWGQGREYAIGNCLVSVVFRFEFEGLAGQVSNRSAIDPMVPDRSAIVSDRSASILAITSDRSAIGDAGQFTNSWLKMNTAPSEFGEAVSPCHAMPCPALTAPRPSWLAAPYLFNGTSSSGPHECRLSANDDGCRCRRIVRVFPPLAQ